MKRMDFGFAHSAQGMLKQSEKPAACGAACGAGDKPAEEKLGLLQRRLPSREASQARTVLYHRKVKNCYGDKKQSPRPVFP